VEAVVLSTEPTTMLPTSTTPIWDAYLVPESGRRTPIKVVDGVVWDETDIRRSNRRKWTLVFGGTMFLVVGAVIAVSLWWWMRKMNEDRSITIVTLNGPPLSAPTTILSSTGRLGDM